MAPTVGRAQNVERKRRAWSRKGSDWWFEHKRSARKRDCTVHQDSSANTRPSWESHMWVETTRLERQEKIILKYISTSAVTNKNENVQYVIAQHKKKTRKEIQHRIGSCDDRMTWLDSIWRIGALSIGAHPLLWPTWTDSPMCVRDCPILMQMSEMRANMTCASALPG